MYLKLFFPLLFSMAVGMEEDRPFLSSSSSTPTSSSSSSSRSFFNRLISVKKSLSSEKPGPVVHSSMVRFQVRASKEILNEKPDYACACSGALIKEKPFGVVLTTILCLARLTEMRVVKYRALSVHGKSYNVRGVVLINMQEESAENWRPENLESRPVGNNSLVLVALEGVGKESIRLPDDNTLNTITGPLLAGKWEYEEKWRPSTYQPSSVGSLANHWNEPRFRFTDRDAYKCDIGSPMYAKTERGHRLLGLLLYPRINMHINVHKFVKDINEKVQEMVTNPDIIVPLQLQ